MEVVTGGNGVPTVKLIKHENAEKEEKRENVDKEDPTPPTDQVRI